MSPAFSSRFCLMAIPLLALASTLAAQTVLTRPIGDCKLKFQDEFNGTRIDTTVWHYRTDSKHWSTQTPANVSLADGMLNLNVKKETLQGMEYTGAGIITKKGFRYGYYESRFKIPKGKGWHTSFWLMNYDPVNATTFNPNAYQEIDICENNSKNATAYSTNLHNWHDFHWSVGGKSIGTPVLRDDFHIWGCDFSPTELRYYFDGKLVNTINPARQKHGDVSIWLTTIASSLGGTDTVDQAALPSAAVFDYVRYYELLNPVYPDTLVLDTTVHPDSTRPHFVVDNTDSGFTVDSAWTASTFTSGYYGRDYLNDGTSAADADRWAKWTPVIPAADPYRLFMRWPAGENRPNHVPVEIVHAGGSDTLWVNQKVDHARWMYLGTYPFAKGKAGSIKISGTSPGYTIADALLFEQAKPISVAVGRIPLSGNGFRIDAHSSAQGLTLSLALATSGRVSIAIYDLHGRLVGTPLASRNLPAGRFHMPAATPPAGGAYLVRMSLDGKAVAGGRLIW